MEEHSLYFAMSIVFVLVISFYFLLRTPGNAYLPRLGIDPGPADLFLLAAKREFHSNGHRLVQQGYEKFSGQNFVVQTQDMERLILSPNYLQELRMVSESKLSHALALVTEHLGSFTGVDVILESRQHSDVCRVQLTQNLGVLLPHMIEELHLAMSKHLKSCNSTDYKPFLAYQFIFAMILAATSRSFVGESLCRDPEWLDIVSSYLAEVNATADALRAYPVAIRPFLRPFLRPRKTYSAILHRAHKIFDPIIQDRLSGSKSNDVLQYLIDTSTEVQTTSIILKILVLASAALHTSCMAAVNSLFDLCARPRYIDSLRKEVRETLGKDSYKWTLPTINKLREMDSFFKESMRYNPPQTFGFNRVAVSHVQLSDGTSIRPGAFVSMASEAMTRDPKYYENPDEFNPKRFYDPQSSKAHQPIYDFSGIEEGNIMWGNGRLTCPGRWYASVLNKAIVGLLLLNYDFKFREGQSARPAAIRSNGRAIPSPMQEIYFRIIN